MHYACMPSITIREVPDSARDELAARAARAGKSLQEYLRGSLIELAAKPDVAQIIERVRARKEATGSVLGVDEILGHVDAERR